MLQALETKKWYTDNSAGMTKAFGNFTSNLKLGIAFQQEEFNSSIFLDENTDALGSEFVNIMEFNSNEIYLNQRLSYKNKSETWNFRLSTPLNFKTFELNGQNVQNLEVFVFEPNLYLRRKLSAYWEASLSAGLNYDFGNLQRLYPDFVLTNYRNIQRYDTPILESVSQSYSGSLNYRNPLKRLFIKGSYTFGTTTNNLLYSNKIQPNGATILEAILLDNTFKTQRLKLDLSKYISKWNTSLKLNTTYATTQRGQQLNSQLTEIKNESIRLNGMLESEISQWLSLSYSGVYSFFKSSLQGNSLQHVNTQNHQADLYLYLWENQYLSLGGEYYNNSISESDRNYFLNLSYQYTITKKKIDLNLSWTNILNTQTFVNASSSEYFITQTSYMLRPSQIIIGISFSLN